MIIGNIVRDDPVDFLREREIFVVCPKPRFHVRYFYSGVIGGKSAGESPGRVALYEYNIGFCRGEQFSNCANAAHGEQKQRLIGLHKLKVVVGAQAEKVQNLPHHIAVLAGATNAGRKICALVEFNYEWSQFDGFRPGSQDKNIFCRALVTHGITFGSGLKDASGRQWRSFVPVSLLYHRGGFLSTAT